MDRPIVNSGTRDREEIEEKFRGNRAAIYLQPLETVGVVGRDIFLSLDRSFEA